LLKAEFFNILIFSIESDKLSNKWYRIFCYVFAIFQSQQRFFAVWETIRLIKFNLQIM